MDTLEREPENDPRILELSNMLRALESPANPYVGEFLGQVRSLAEFNVGRKRIQEIFLTARRQLGERDFTGAMDTYASGLDVFQEAFFAAGYGRQAEQTASNGLTSLNRSIQQFKTLVPSLMQTSARLTALDVPPGVPAIRDLQAVYANVPPMLQTLSSIRQEFLRVQVAYAAQLAILQAEQDIEPERSFLAATGWLITGPVGQQEGMLGAIDQFWNSLILPMETALANIISRSYQTGYTAMRNNDFTGGIAIFDTTARYIAVAQGLVREADGFFTRAGSPTQTVHGQDISTASMSAYLTFRGASDSQLALQQAAVFARAGVAIERQGIPPGSRQAGTANAAQIFSQESTIRNALQEQIRGLQALHSGLDDEIQVARSYGSTLAVPLASGSILGNPRHFLEPAQDIIANLSRRFEVLDFNTAIRLYSIANISLQQRLDYAEGIFAEGDSLIQGVQRQTENFGAQTVRYTAEGIAILNRINQTITADVAFAGELMAMYEAETRTAFASPEITGLHTVTDDLHNQLVALHNRNAGAIATAATLVERAQALRVDGERLFQSARAAFNRGDFSGARTNLTRAIDQFDASLELQESAPLRAFRDTNSVALAAEIVRAENEAVVRDVRNLVTSAQTSFFAGNMESAESLLVQAQNRWRVTNVNEQPEVEHWLRLVRSALALNMARVIPQTAPLFAEMSQLLSNASRNYNEGVRLLNAGRRQEGLRLFNEAQMQTREVRLIFPMNHSARMLELRIEQQTDRAAFNAAFQRRLNEAVAGTRARDLEAFANLQDLAEINPQYPGIQNIIVQAEITMGFRPPPPNPADLARSAELTRTAAAHINSRDSVRMGVAEAQLTEAINLNPNNTQAQMLMDQLNVLVTGTGTFVLSSYAQTQYNTALAEFLRGNHLTANAIVQQLMLDPQSQRSTLVRDLRRRIDAFL
ncbi:MAG: hypothetical protein FWD91_01845 [Treponema sp.]|nr:hypothetical protein [Treponema sp.]